MSRCRRTRRRRGRERAAAVCGWGSAAIQACACESCLWRWRAWSPWRVAKMIRACDLPRLLKSFWLFWDFFELQRFYYSVFEIAPCCIQNRHKLKNLPANTNPCKFSPKITPQPLKEQSNTKLQNKTTLHAMSCDFCGKPGSQLCPCHAAR